MPGLFIQQLAEALSESCNVAVLTCVPDPGCVGKREIEIGMEQGVHVVRVYYKESDSTIPRFTALLKAYWFFLAYREGFRALRFFEPDLMHVHVLTRHGVVAWLGRVMTGTPYIISEHWSRYFRENGTYRGLLRKWMTRWVVKRASAVVTVSELLKKAMEQQGLSHARFAVIPNPVNMDAFSPAERKPQGHIRRILHLSCFEDKSKNISGLLQVIARLASRRDDFICELAGEGPDLEAMKQLAASLRLLTGTVSFSGLKTGEDLTECIRQADFMVLSSRYETFGTVLVESMACGVPVVSTAVGIAPEIVNRDTGILVPPGDETALIAAIDNMLDRCRSYDPFLVRAAVFERFSAKTVAKHYIALYTQIKNQNLIIKS